MSLKLINTKGIKCPVCGKGKIIDSVSDIWDNRLCILPPDRSEDAKWFVKCPKCKNQIGLVVKG